MTAPKCLMSSWRFVGVSRCQEGARSMLCHAPSTQETVACCVIIMADDILSEIMRLHRLLRGSFRNPSFFPQTLVKLSSDNPAIHHNNNTTFSQQISSQFRNFYTHVITSICNLFFFIFLVTTSFLLFT